LPQIVETTAQAHGSWYVEKMRERLTHLLKDRANSHEIAIFSAGSDPLCAETQFLVDWLTEQKAAFSVVDALQDPELSPLLQADCATKLLPILTVNGHLIANGALLKQLAESGQLSQLIQKPAPDQTPAIAVSQLAVARLRSALESPTDVVRLTISSDFCHELGVSEMRPGDIELKLGDVTLVVDPISASRANGLAIDWVQQAESGGFRIDNPNRRSVLRSVKCDDLAQLMGGPNPPFLIDARTEQEYNDARISGAHLLEANLLDALQLLDRQTPLVFYCKNGTRSQRAAQHCSELGYMDVATLVGGMDAWLRHFES
jgi:rhodanese-related sulfurtransferase/Fe-S cluster assembly iron-binding protein IscA/glutaredoxin-related protein